LPFEQPIYVHIFTDDPYPEKIANQYEQAIKKDSEIALRNSLAFGWQNSSQDDANVLASFFAMASCDYLVMPMCSAFSRVAHFVGNHKGAFRGLEK